MGLIRAIEQAMTTPQLTARSTAERRAAADRKREDVRSTSDRLLQELNAGINAATQQRAERLAQIDRDLRDANAERRAELIAELRAELEPLIDQWSIAPTRPLAASIDKATQTTLAREHVELEPTNSGAIAFAVVHDLLCEAAMRLTPGAVGAFASGGLSLCSAEHTALTRATGSPVAYHNALSAYETKIASIASAHVATTPDASAQRRWIALCKHDAEALAKFDTDEAAAKQQAFVASYTPPPGARVG
jgi:hypothetical protein